MGLRRQNVLRECCVHVQTQADVDLIIFFSYEYWEECCVFFVKLCQGSVHEEFRPVVNLACSFASLMYLYYAGGDGL